MKLNRFLWPNDLVYDDSYDFEPTKFRILFFDEIENQFLYWTGEGWCEDEASAIHFDLIRKDYLSHLRSKYDFDSPKGCGSVRIEVLNQSNEWEEEL